MAVDHQPVRLAFDANEVATLAALNQNLEAQTKRLKNPHLPDNLAWPPGSSVVLAAGRLSIIQTARSHHHEKHGLEYFLAVAAPWSLKNVCMP